MKAQTFIVLSLIFLVNSFDEATAQDVQELLQMLRQKVQRLQETGRIDKNDKPYFQKKVRDGEIYDFIIVGAGSAGSALVHRLSEVSEWKILLLEAGGEPDILSDIPFWSTLGYQTHLNWHYVTEKEENSALGIQGQRYRWHRGKGLGGSSLINLMVATRGAKADYDKWAAMGNPGWSYEEIQPYLKKLEDARVYRQDADYRGHKGPITVEDPYYTKSGTLFVKAAANSGYRYVDYNGRNHHGVSYAQATTKNGLRCSGESCYIRPIRNRLNLTIRLQSHVTKVLIEKGIAYGVEYYKDGKTYTAYAHKEVILSSGAIGSPHILLLSGIGPREQLLGFGIEPIIDLPVGQKVIDHLGYFGLGFTFNQSIVLDAQSAMQDQAFISLYNHGQGVLQSLGTIEALIFSNIHTGSDSEVDLELVYISSFLSSNPNTSTAAQLAIRPDLYDATFKRYEGVPTGGCVPAVIHPKSFGKIELRSPDPLVYPKLYANYYTDPEGADIRMMIAGIRECIRVMLSPPFDKYGVSVIDEPILGCRHLHYDSDEYWECAVRHLTGSLFHQCTSCKMGPAHDPEAVVDSRLRVYGIADLRVVDTSIIPTSMTGHTNIPAFLVAEKAADIIKEDHLGKF